MDELIKRLAEWLCWRSWGMHLDDAEMAEEVREDWRSDARELLGQLGVKAVAGRPNLVYVGKVKNDSHR